MLYSPAPLHIPDGFLAPVTWGPAAVVAAGTAGVAVRHVRRDLRGGILEVMRRRKSEGP